jgi:hypothetical protein
MSTLADVDAYERAANPDQVNIYGFIGLSAECAGRAAAGGRSAVLLRHGRFAPLRGRDHAGRRFESVPTDVELGGQGMLMCRACPAARRARVRAHGRRSIGSTR